MQNNSTKELNSFPLLFGKEGLKYQVDKIIVKDDTRKHLMEMGFVKDSVLELVSRQSKGVIVKIFGSKLALDYKVAQKIYVHEYKLQNIETL